MSLAFDRQDGNVMPYPPAQSKRGFWKIEVLRTAGAEIDVRRETIDASGDLKT